MKLLSLAWRNIWRNKKRTLITAGSVFFALTLSIFMVGMQQGSYDSMIKTSVEDFYGYIQIHQKGYTEDRTLINSFENTDELTTYLINTENVTSLHPRLETFTLSAFGEKTKGIAVIGVNPELEFSKPGLKKRLVEGSFPTSENGGLVITQKYAEYIGATIGDSIAFIGQGYQGVSAVGLYPVVGIINLINPQLNSGMAYMEISEAQELFNMENRLTSLVVRLDNNSKFEKTAKTIVSELQENYEALTWEEEMPILVQMIESDSNSGKIILYILYIVIGFGIFGTALMMIAERTKEFGVMVAVGMHTNKIVKMISFEMIFISIVGIVAGIIASFPIMYYFHLNPIRLTGELATTYASYGYEPVMPVSWQFGTYVGQPMIVLLITIVAILYPILSVNKLNVMKALRR